MKYEFKLTIDEITVSCYFNSKSDLTLAMLPLTRMLTMLSNEATPDTITKIMESKCGYKVIKTEPGFPHGTIIQFEVCEGTIAYLHLDDC